MEKFRNQSGVVLAAMSLMALFCPVTVGYSVAFLVLCWLVLDFALRRNNADPFSAEWEASSVYRSLAKVLTIGLALYIGLTTISALVSAVIGSSEGLSKVLWHFTVKESLIWLVLVAFWWRFGALQLPWRPALMGVGVWAVAYLVYCAVQRQTGIDWVHGFDAQLGQHRFAYGVYRISGMMGHPLTLSYNMLLIGMATMVFGAADRPHRWLWFVIAGACFAIVLISGSRFPILLVIGAICLSQLTRSKKAVLAAGAGVILLALAVYWEGSMIGRVSELFQADRALEERFPRAVFWRVHWLVFLDHVVWGAGLHNIESWLTPYYNELAPHAKMKYTAHNIYLQTMADSGLVGLLGLTSFLVSIVLAWNICRRQLVKSAFPYLIYGVGAAGLIQSVLRDSECVLAAWVLLPLVALKAAELSLSSQRRDNAAGKSPQNFKSAAGDANSAAYLPGQSGGDG